MNTTTIGIDLAKNIFHIWGVNTAGKKTIKKKTKRDQIITFFSNLEPCLIGLEACLSAHYWARQLSTSGHDVKIMAPKYVILYRLRQKNDFNDAQAICEAVTRPSTRFVPMKTQQQQDLQSIHRVRSRLVKDRTALACQTRGLLLEYGFAIKKGIHYVRAIVPLILEEATNGLSLDFRALIQELYERLVTLDDQVKIQDHRLKQLHKQSPASQRLEQIPGIGVLFATGLIAAIGDGSQFNSSRDLAAWLGLVPRQHSSGDKTVLMGITKQGDPYLRTLLIHGCRAVAHHADGKTDALSQWVNRLKKEKGMSVATVALANKTARIAFAIHRKEVDYRPFK